MMPLATLNAVFLTGLSALIYRDVTLSASLGLLTATGHLLFGATTGALKKTRTKNITLNTL